MNDEPGMTQPLHKQPVQQLDDNLEDEAIDLTQPIPQKDRKDGKKLPVTGGGLLRAFGMLLLGVLILLGMAVAGGWLGANSAMELRYEAQRTLVSGQASEQFLLAMQDLESGRYSIAATRVSFVSQNDRSSVPASEVARLYQEGLDYISAGQFDRAQANFELVLILDANFPGIRDALAEVMLLKSRTATPTLQFTPTITPTPDVRGEEELFKQIQASVAAREWDAAIDAITNLRNGNPTFRAVEVDGLYYTALRNRGVDRILVRGEPERGIFDLTLAERIGPLDRDADSYRTWARYYITGASFWQADWERAVYYFEMIYPALPNLRDSSNLTAIERFRISALRFADQMALAGDYCKAEEYYGKSMQVNNDPAIQPTRQYAYEQCLVQPESTPTPDGSEPTPTSQEPGDTPTETPNP